MISREGAGKTTLVLHLTASAQGIGRVALVIDTDLQATPSQCADLRRGALPEVIVIDTPPTPTEPRGLRSGWRT